MIIQHLTSDVARTTTTGWQAEHPARFRAAISTVATDEQSVHLGIFRDNHLLSVVTLQPQLRGVYEVHCAIRRGQSVAELLPAFLSIRAQLFGELGVREIVGWVPRLHTGIRRVAHVVGFKETGVNLIQMVNGRLSEWRHLSLRTN